MLNRLLGMIYILMNKGTVTAGELAKRFEVSVRTIYRDVETLSMAGIPIYARKGKNGGISLTEQFILNKMLVSEKEQTEILAALTSLQQVGAQNEQETLRKLGEFFQTEPMQWVSIDLSDWSGRRQELYGQLKEAVLNRKKIHFDYYGQYGEMSTRTVWPMQLLFKEYTWYLKAYCESRQDMRLFKVLRMKRVEVLEDAFETSGHMQASENKKKEAGAGKSKTDENRQKKTEGNCLELNEGSSEKGRKKEREDIEISLLLQKKEAYRVYDRFEEEDITVLENGDFLIKARYLMDDWVYGMILSFGPSAKVMEPSFVREEVKKRLIGMLKLYEE